MDVKQLARQLVEIYSPSGAEKEVCEYIANLLSKEFEVKKQKVENAFNILATVGNPEVILTAHIDTVPGKLAIKNDGKYLYGRGACDAKASVAAIIVAAMRAKKEGYTNFGMLFDIQEESNFAGIKQAVKLCEPKLVVIGEPTDFEVQTGQKGLLGFKVICRGVSAHGATPEKGKSAIMKLNEAINKLAKLKLPKNATLNIGLISGGSAINNVPDYAEASIEIRTTDDSDIIGQIKTELGKLADIELLCNYAPYSLGDNSIISKFANLFEKRGTRLETFVAPFFTEQYFWSDACAIVVGPGDSTLAHTDSERIKLDELEKGVEVYLEILRGSCKNENK